MDRQKSNIGECNRKSSSTFCSEHSSECLPLCEPSEHEFLFTTPTSDKESEIAEMNRNLSELLVRLERDQPSFYVKDRIAEDSDCILKPPCKSILFNLLKKLSNCKDSK